MADLRTIAEGWLREHGYEGLCLPREDCGCVVGDLMPCGAPGTDCEPAFAAKDGIDFLMFPTKKQAVEHEEALADGAEAANG